MTIPFETGIPSLLKEKGFDTLTNLRYVIFTNSVESRTSDGSANWNAHVKNSNCISAPDYDQVLDWLEEKHGIIVSVRYNPTNSIYKRIVEVYLNDDVEFIEAFNSKYEALNAGILESLKLIMK